MSEGRHTPVPGDSSEEAAPRPPVDTEQHGTTRMSGGSPAECCETTIWVFRDPRKTKVSIYRGFEGLPWAISDLVRKTNAAIGRGEVEGQALSVGDVVQACVVSYYDGEVRKPQTTADSPRYATLPYRIVRAEGGHMSAEPAIPPETALHFNIPATVGDLVPNLDEDARRELLVTLQLKEAAHKTDRTIEESVQDVVRAREVSYDVSEKADEEAGAFLGFLANEGKEEHTPVSPPPRPSHAETVRLRRTITQRLQKRAKDAEDFGFSAD